MLLSDFDPGGGIFKARRGRIEDELRKIADRAEPNIKRAIYAALAAGDRATIADLAAALTTGDVPRVLALLGLDALEQRLGAMVDAIRAAISAAGTAGAAMVPPIARPFGAPLEVRFDVMNPATARFVQEYEFRLIREISERTREGIRVQVAEGIRGGRNPRAVAREIKQTVGLTERQARAVANFRAELESFHLRQSAAGWNLGGAKTKAPGGAGVMAIDRHGNPIDRIFERRLRDFRFDRTLIQAMEKGEAIPADKIDKMVARYRERWIAYRAETIARTEALRAVNAGNHEAWRQGIASGAVKQEEVRKFWRTAGDERVRMAHRPIPSMNPDGVAFDEMFNTPSGPVLHPPLGVNCRCVVFYRVLA